MMVTESSWVPPLGYQSEGPFLMAVYQSLTGMDNYYWFSADDPVTVPIRSSSGTRFPMGRRACSSGRCIPAFPRTFPAAACFTVRAREARRRVVHEERSLQNCWTAQRRSSARARVSIPIVRRSLRKVHRSRAWLIHWLFWSGRVEVKVRRRSGAEQSHRPVKVY
jgi:hypothetical protein